MGAVDGGADHLAVLEGVGVLLAATGEPISSARRTVAIAARRLDLLLRLADALAHPGEIANFNAQSSIRWRTPARK
jgi:hypothetical protein